MMLKEAGKNAEAMEFAEKAVREGRSTGKLKEYLEEVYTKEKGEEGWDSYLARLEEAYRQKLCTELAGEMISEKAPVFTLKNMQGEEVSLEALKGYPPDK